MPDESDLEQRFRDFHVRELAKSEAERQFDQWLERIGVRVNGQTNYDLLKEMVELGRLSVEHPNAARWLFRTTAFLLSGQKLAISTAMGAAFLTVIWAAAGGIGTLFSKWLTP